VLKYLELNESGKNADFAQLLGVSPQRVWQILQDMLQKGLIEKHGDKRYTHYTLRRGRYDSLAAQPGLAEGTLVVAEGGCGEGR
jgi:predicted transcriptional regulator